MTTDDIVEALNRAWDDEPALTREPRSVDVIVHSTGGLVIRHWLSTMKPEEVPIHRLLMLAPANFGSPLAHTGRSVFGRAIKGWGGNRLFNTGTYILKALELASPYSWALAFEDRFGPKNYYGSGKVLCTVLVGNSGYTGISALANKPGTDGTVRVSTANLECAYLDADFSEDPLQPKVKPMRSGKGQVAFGIMDGENHSTVAAKDRGPKSDQTLPMIVEALQVSDDNFGDWCKRLTEHSESVMASRVDEGAHYHGYQHTVFKVTDQFDNAVDDYVIEMYLDEPSRSKRNNHVTQKIQENAIASVHVYSGDKSFRSMLIDCDALWKLLDNPDEKLKISLTAAPEFGGRNDVGYKTFGDDDIGFIEVSYDQARKLFQPNRTLLILIRLKRWQSERVFEFRRI